MENEKLKKHTNPEFIYGKEGIMYLPAQCVVPIL